MSEPEDFLTRWSRRKRVEEEPDQPASSGEAVPETPAKAGDSDALTGKPALATDDAPAPAFDPASLPSLDSIGAQTDIRAFLQAGVPNALRLAALRRAWSADPAILNFKGLAEYDWDVTAVDSMPGFGELGPGVNVKKMLEQVLGEPPRQTEPTTKIPPLGEELAPAEGNPELAPPPQFEAASDSGIVQGEENIAARDNDSKVDGQADDGQVKRHGGALPQ
jgi:hypothetical protein